jgi:hypothetical protein
MNIRYGEELNKTEDVAGRMLEREREMCEALTAESLRISTVVMCAIL